MTNQDRRRPAHREPHALTIHAVADRLIAICKCGATLGGQRDTDTTRMTLSDLAALTVKHTAEHGHH